MGKDAILGSLFLIVCWWSLSSNPAYIVRAYNGGTIPERLPTNTKYTSAVLKVSYDGRLFNGWAAANDGSSTGANDAYQPPRRSGRARRDKHRPSMRKGEVRSVEGSLKGALSKLYGNVSMQRIIVEGCSRTDKGVHSKSSYALIYCLLDDDEQNNPSNAYHIEGKKLPHPRHASDETFKALPFDSDLQRMMFALNKMLPPDVRVLNASPMPEKDGSNTLIVDSDSGSTTQNKLSRPFHPSLDTLRKMYRYTLSVGEIHDPIRTRDVWNVPYCTHFELERARECAQQFIGSHDFIAYRGAFRGNERGKTQNTVCTLFDIQISEEKPSIVNEYAPTPTLCQTYTIDIFGDRFLYKMVRFLVGTIVQYATSDRIEIDDVVTTLNSGRWETSTGEDKEDVSPPRFCAPPHGLSLRSVEFDSSWKFNWMVDQQSYQPNPPTENHMGAKDSFIKR